MSEAKITIVGEDLASAVVEKVGEKLKGVGDQAATSSPKVSAFGQYVKGLTPDTENAGAAFTGLHTTLTGVFDNPTAAAQQLGGALASDLAGGLGSAGVAAGIAVGAFAALGAATYGIAAHAAEIGASLGDMADKTGMSVPALSRLSVAAQVAGTDLGTLTNVVFMLERKMGEGGDAFEKGLKKMGLSTADLKAAGPDGYLDLLAKGLAGIVDPSDRAAAGNAVLGRSYRDSAAALQDLGKAMLLTNDITPWTQAQADEAEQFEMQMKSIWIHAEALGTGLGRVLIPAVSGTVSVIINVGEELGTAAGYVSGIIPLWNDMAAAVGYAAAAMDVLRGYAVAVPDVTGPATKGVDAWKTSIAEMALKVPDLTAALDLDKRSAKDLDDHTRELAAAHKKAGEEAKKHAEESKKLAGELLKVEGSLTDIPDSIGKMGRSFDEAKLGKVSDDVLRVESSAHIAVFGFRGMADGIEQVGIKSKVALDEADKWAFVGPVLDVPIQKVETLAGTFEKLPGIMTAALTGGGGLSGAAKAIGSDVGHGLGTQLASKLTSTLTADGAKALSPLMGNLVAAIPVIGAMVGPLVGPVIDGLKRLFGGVSDDVRKARDAVAGFETGLHTTLTATQQAEAGGVSWKQTLISIRDAYIATGRSEADAEAAAKTLWASQSQGAAAAKAAIDQVNLVLDEGKQDQADLEAATKKYKFSIEELGPAMQKQQLSKQATTLENDFRLLVGSGMDVKTVIDHMGGSINEFLANAKKTGGEVPSEMKPILEKMIEMGTLTDENGTKITDLGSSGFTFSETMTQGFDRIVGKLSDLINKIAGTTGALNAIPTRKDIDINYHQHTDGDAPPNAPRDTSYANEGFDLTTPVRALVGDNPFQSESVLHASTVRDIVRAARSAGAAVGGAVGGGEWKALADGIGALHETMKQQGRQIAQALTTQPFAMRDAVLVRGSR